MYNLRQPERAYYYLIIVVIKFNASAKIVSAVIIYLTAEQYELISRPTLTISI